MPKPNYEQYIKTDLYTQMYEQYYFKNTPIKKITPIKRKPIKKKKLSAKKILLLILAFIPLIYTLSYSFENFTKDIFINKSKTVLNIDYTNLLYPTNNYLYKDLFLGKYSIKDTTYKEHTMTDIPESTERLGLKQSLISLADQYKRIQPAVYVWEYNGKSFVDINADMPYPAASIIKIPVLIEMFRNIDRNNLSLSDTMILEDFYRAPVRENFNMRKEIRLIPSAFWLKQ